jgi:flavin reductase (DIM6/NTAB) family NADH-FMN oxidoreductase RutF
MTAAHGEIVKALALLPTVRIIMTSAFEQGRAGVLVHWAMQCAASPLFICVAVLKGNRISPIIRDSRCFALCLVDGKSKLLLRKFDDDSPEGDQFDSFGLKGLKTGSPILACSIAAIDCEVVRHFDLEADHELYIGQVMDARVFGDPGTRH